MKTNPLLLAITFLLGCLVTLVAIDSIRTPVYADTPAGASASGIDNLSVATLAIDQNREALVVFKRVPNPLSAGNVEDPDGKKKKKTTTPDANDPKFVTSMAVYEYSISGPGRGKLILAANRFIDYDMNNYQWANENGKVVDVTDAREGYLKAWNGKVMPEEEK